MYSNWFVSKLLHNSTFDRMHGDSNMHIYIKYGRTITSGSGSKGLLKSGQFLFHGILSIFTHKLERH